MGAVVRRSPLAQLTWVGVVRDWSSACARCRWRSVGAHLVDRFCFPAAKGFTF